VSGAQWPQGFDAIIMSAAVRAGYVAANRQAVRGTVFGTDQDRALDPDGVHDGADVLHARVERRETAARQRIRQARSASSDEHKLAP